jgi:hypothetical protein
MLCISCLHFLVLRCLADLRSCTTQTSSKVSSCFDLDVDADAEEIYEVSFLQTRLAVGDQRSLLKHGDQAAVAPAKPEIAVVAAAQSLLAKPDIAGVAAAAQSPVPDTSDEATLQDPFAHLLQTELQLSPPSNASSEGVGLGAAADRVAGTSTRAAVAAAVHAQHKSKVSGDEVEPVAWTFMSCSFIFTLLCIWHGLQTPSTAGDSQDKTSHGVFSNQYDSHVAGPIIAELRLSGKDDRWDFIRLLLIWALISSHLAGSFYAKAGLSLDQAIPGVAAWAISGFVFLSGMFSSSLSTKPMMMTLVGLPCTLFLLAAVTWIATIVSPGKMDTFEIGRSLAEWYVECMVLWRLTVSPLFRFSEKLGTPRALPFLVVCGFSCALLSCTFRDPLEIDVRLIPIRLCFPWRMFATNAPFFAAGLLFSPSRWSELMDQRRAIWAAYFCLAMCALASQWPHPFGAASWAHLLGNTLGLYAFGTVCMVVATTLVIGSWLGPLKQLAPTVADHLICCSRRSLQAFNLHWPLFVLLGGRLGLANLAQWLIPVGSASLASQSIVIVSTALWLTLVLSSHFSELLFGWLLNLPVQLVDILSQRIDGGSRATQKALDVFGVVKIAEVSDSLDQVTYAHPSLPKKLTDERTVAAAAAIARALLTTETVGGH